MQVAQLIDATASENKDGLQGVRQLLEKKEGLFRMNMMGKRVNFAARSVISPDPNIGTGEIGVPPFFAARLSFPEAVTQFNHARMQQLVLNGAHEYPGAPLATRALSRTSSHARMQWLVLHGAHEYRGAPLATRALSRTSRQ